MIIGIVGSEGAKFTPQTEARAKALIRELISFSDVTGISSGHCHLGGIDIWAEEIATELGKGLYIFPPKTLSWESGYKPRNILIAKTSDVVHNITLKTLPDSFQGMRFEGCYHCKTKDHVKSGGCWTARYAQSIGKRAQWHIIGESQLDLAFA